MSHISMSAWVGGISLRVSLTLSVIPLIYAFLFRNMNNEDIKRQIVEALTNGTLQPTTIILGDQVQHQHQQNMHIDKVEAGGIGFQVLEPSANALRRPKEGNYNGVREYIEERKKIDDVFKEYCKSHSRKDLCARLSDEFGWFVDPHHLGVNEGRNK